MEYVPLILLSLFSITILPQQLYLLQRLQMDPLGSDGSQLCSSSGPSFQRHHNSSYTCIICNDNLTVHRIIMTATLMCIRVVWSFSEY